MDAPTHRWVNVYEDIYVKYKLELLIKRGQEVRGIGEVGGSGRN